MVLHQTKKVGATARETNSECTILAYIGIILTILSLIIVTFLHYRKSILYKGHKFSNVVKIMIFISDVQNYVPIKLCKAAGSIHLIKIIGILKAKNIKLNKNYLWDTLEIDWKEVTVTFNDNKKDLPRIVVIKLQDKIEVRRLKNREPLLFHLMLKQGIALFTLATETQETMYILNKISTDILPTFYFQMACILQPKCNFLHGFCRYHLPVEMVGVEVRITSMQGTHMFRRDGTCQLIKCNAWSTRLWLHPTIIKKMKTYLELKGKLAPKSQSQSSQFRPP